MTYRQVETERALLPRCERSVGRGRRGIGPCARDATLVVRVVAPRDSEPQLMCRAHERRERERENVASAERLTPELLLAHRDRAVDRAEHLLARVRDELAGVLALGDPSDPDLWHDVARRMLHVSVSLLPGLATAKRDRDAVRRAVVEPLP